MKCIFRLNNLIFVFFALMSLNIWASDKKLAYIVSDLRIPYWNIMWEGVQSKAIELGYSVNVYSAHNNSRKELENTLKAIKQNVDGIVLSPTNSSAAVTILKFAKKANIPVVISDIGAEAGEYLSYIESDNFGSAYQLGKLLSAEFFSRGWEDSSVGIIAIPQTRKNGKLRTDGFLTALNEAGINADDIRQQVDFSYRETYLFSRELITSHTNMRALWLQGSDRYQGALDAIRDSDREGEVLLICFDAEPEFINMIREEKLLAAGMQQPFLMGEEAVQTLQNHFDGGDVMRENKLEVLAVSKKNIDKLLPVIERNVLGIRESRNK